MTDPGEFIWETEKNNQIRTITISFPAAFLKALVHLTLRGFRFILTQKLENGIQLDKWAIALLKILMASVVGCKQELSEQGKSVTYFDVQNRKTFASFLTKAVPKQ
jgi:hypothetical protein